MADPESLVENARSTVTSRIPCPISLRAMSASHPISNRQFVPLSARTNPLFARSHQSAIQFLGILAVRSDLTEGMLLQGPAARTRNRVGGGPNQFELGISLEESEFLTAAMEHGTGGVTLLRSEVVAAGRCYAQLPTHENVNSGRAGNGSGTPLTVGTNAGSDEIFLRSEGVGVRGGYAQLVELPTHENINSGRAGIGNGTLFHPSGTRNAFPPRSAAGYSSAGTSYGQHNRREAIATNVGFMNSPFLNGLREFARRENFRRHGLRFRVDDAGVVWLVGIAAPPPHIAIDMPPPPAPARRPESDDYNDTVMKTVIGVGIGIGGQAFGGLVSHAITTSPSYFSPIVSGTGLAGLGLAIAAKTMRLSKPKLSWFMMKGGAISIAASVILAIATTIPPETAGIAGALGFIIVGTGVYFL